jgi:hypothetical protein
MLLTRLVMKEAPYPLHVLGEESKLWSCRFLGVPLIASSLSLGQGKYFPEKTVSRSITYLVL